MRHIAQFAILLPLAAVTAAHAANVTLVLDFEGAHSVRAVKTMQQELNRVFESTNVRVDLKLKKEIPRNPVFADVVMVKMRGNCRWENYAPLLDERGAFAWTHTSDGVILPFSEVACDRVRQSIAEAMWGGQRREAENLFGRALARVVAHELMHILGQCPDHSQHGIFKHALSGKQLIAEKLDWTPADMARLP